MSDIRSTRSIREAYALTCKGERSVEQEAEFDRWLTEYTRQAKAEAVAEHRAEVRKQEREETAKVLRNWAKHLTAHERTAED